jgi:hypothetical protein
VKSSYARRNSLMPAIALSISSCADARFGHDPGNGATVASDDDGFAAHHFIKEPGKVRFGVRRLDFTHDNNRA